ncbi:MAG: cell division protein FtsA [Sneathiellaceae bacterium]
MGSGRSGLIVALDVGTTKVSCFVARNLHGQPRIVGIGHQAARGMRAGAVIDMDAVEGAVRAAVDSAERMSGEKAREVLISLSAGQPVSQMVNLDVSIAGHAVTDGDVRRVLARARALEVEADRHIVHAIPTSFDIDGCRGIRDPRGMYGERLGVTMNLITASTGPMRNLANCVARAHLDLEAVVVSPYAAGLACLEDDQMELGVAVIDMGGGTTKIGVFYDGGLVFADAVPVGGAHVTTDIARGLTTTLDTAERLKVVHGSALSTHIDEQQQIEIRQVGDHDRHSVTQIPRSYLTGIIRPRVEETLELVRDRLEHSGFSRLAGRQVVLTGGASQLGGMRELASRILDKQVLIGRPIRVSGLAEATGGPGFSTCAGLLSYALREHARLDDPTESELPEPIPSTGRIARMGKWLMANF